MDYENMAKELMSIMEKDHRLTRHVREPIGGEAFVLFVIFRCGGYTTPSEISYTTGVSTARVAATLKNLEKKELIMREIDTEDRRKVQIRITNKGEKEVEKNYNQLLNNTIKMLSYLGEDDSKEFIRIKKRLLERKHDLVDECTNESDK